MRSSAAAALLNYLSKRHKINFFSLQLNLMPQLKGYKSEMFFKHATQPRITNWNSIFGALVSIFERNILGELSLCAKWMNFSLSRPIFKEIMWNGAKIFHWIHLFKIFHCFLNPSNSNPGRLQFFVLLG